jgi:Raf kinase inhibitor-like YbhB/YbcL family protein
MSLVLKSESFKDGERLQTPHVLSEAYGFGCAGGNLSPQFAWSGVPEGTESFSLTCYDPDAPTGSGFWHWNVANIPSNIFALELGAGDPSAGKMHTDAIEVRTDFGVPGYGGPCAPEGSNIHRYIFTIHAVNVTSLPVTSETTAAVLGFYLHFHTIEKASLIGLFSR